MKEISYADQITRYVSNQFSLSDEQVLSMLPEFKNTLSEHMDTIEQVSQDGDLSALGKAAHTIKGAFLNLGLNDCAELALKIEGSAAQNDVSVDYGSLLKEMRRTVQAIVEE